MASKLGNHRLGGGGVRQIGCGYLITVLAAAQTWAGANDVTFTLVPVGGLNVTGGQTVLVEGFITTHHTARHEGGQWDVPCLVAGSISGTMTATGGCSDCDGDGDNESSGGIPFMFGPTGMNPHASASCITATTPAIGAPSPIIPAGVTRYIGAVNYLVSDCALGDFNIHFECTDQPGGLCDNVPESSNTTRYREERGGGWDQLLSLNLTDTTLSVACRLYGDVVDVNSLPVPDCNVDVSDLLCVLDYFVNPADCPVDGDIFPCDPDGTAPYDHGDGITDVDDIAAVLQAFVGFYTCPHPCPP